MRKKNKKIYSLEEEICIFQEFKMSSKYPIFSGRQQIEFRARPYYAYPNCHN